MTDYKGPPPLYDRDQLRIIFNIDLSAAHLAELIAADRFPQPREKIAGRDVWAAQDIETWLQAHGERR